MIGTSGGAPRRLRASRLSRGRGLFLYRLDDERFCEGGALSDGGNLHAWLLRTLRDVSTVGLAEPAGRGARLDVPAVPRR